MKTEFRETFWRDVRKRVKDKKTIIRIDAAIDEVADARDISEVRNVKKMKGDNTAYRIRVGAFRIGFHVVGDTAEFVRCLPRKDIYRYFP